MCSWSRSPRCCTRCDVATTLIAAEVSFRRRGPGSPLEVSFRPRVECHSHPSAAGRRRYPSVVPRSYWVETLGCPKNQVDSDKLVGTLLRRRHGRRRRRRRRRPRRGQHLRLRRGGPARSRSTPSWPSPSGTPRRRPRWWSPAAWPSATATSWPTPCPRSTRGRLRRAGGPRGRSPGGGRWRWRPRRCPASTCSTCPGPARPCPWAYVKVAEGCDRACGFCAIPSASAARSAPGAIESILAEVDELGAPRGRAGRPGPGRRTARDQGLGEPGHRRRWCGRSPARVDRVRLLYLYPSELTDELIDAIGATGVPVLRPVAAARVAAAAAPHAPVGRRRASSCDRIDDIRAAAPDAAFRSNFIVGYPGETEDDHDQLLRFVARPQLDWCGFFPSRRRTAPTPPTSTAQVDRRARGRAPGRAARAPGRHHRGASRRPDRHRRSRCWSTTPGVGRTAPRGPGDRRHRHGARRPGRRRVPPGAASPAPLGPRPAQAAWPPRPATRGAVRGDRRRDPRPDGAFGPGALLDPGQRHHHRAHAAGPGAVRDDRPAAVELGRCSRCGSSLRSPTASTASSPASTAPPARARSSTRWPTRCWSSAACSPWCGRGGSGGCRWSLIAAARGGRSQPYRSLLGAPRGLAVPASAGAKVKTFLQFSAVGVALLPRLTDMPPGVADAAAVGRRGAHRRVSGRAVPRGRGSRSATTHGTGG